MQIRLGIAPIAWTNSDLPELGGETTLEQCLAESRLAGFSGTETGIRFPMDAAALGPILAAHRLRLVSGWFSGRLLERSVEAEAAALEQQLATFAALGAPVLVYAETTGSVQAQRAVPLAQRPQLNDAEFAAYGRRLTMLAEHLAARGVALAYHHHMGTVVESARDVDRLMAATGPAVGLLLDTGHLAFAGEDPLAVTRRHARRINHVHCKDVRPAIAARARAEGMSFLGAVLAGVFTVPGDGGACDYTAFAALLADIGYQGWAVVEAEQDPERAPPLEYARKGYAHLRQALGVAGYAIIDEDPALASQSPDQGGNAGWRASAR